MLDRTALVAPEELHRDHAFVEGGFGVNPTAVGNTGAAGAGAGAAATRRVQRESVSPEEEERRYLGREERRRRELKEERRRSREEDRERREREEKERTAREDQRGIVAKVGEEEADVAAAAADRAWGRSQRAGNIRCAGYEQSPDPDPGQSRQGEGGTRSVSGTLGPVPLVSVKASGSSGVDIGTLPGETPAPGVKTPGQ